MGKKVKTGKARRDKFYHLAKETGYRARSAFKLLQLNRKYEFLQKSRVCVDLCAAPGGWLQVAANHMPVSSLIIGIDLVPIKPIVGVTTFQEDITTDKCRLSLRKELQTWDADVFLNDGAPNVGKTWIHDAFQQAELTLAALKLATQFLKKGGWFVTKVFRSKDYTSLMWVFGQLFKKVFATKPQASRNESAEIFVVCQHYIKPDKLDPRFLDPKYVFKDVENQGPKKALDLINPKEKKKAEGYADDDYTLHHKLKVTDFIASENHMELLADSNEVILDDDEVANHKLTTPELKECLKDIKVLGKKEIKGILNWRRKMKNMLDKKEKKEAEQNEAEVVEEEEEGTDSEEEIEQKIASLEEEEAKDAKRKRKKIMKEKRKLRDKMALKMIIPGDTMEVSEDMELFKLNKIKSKKELQEVEREDLPDVSSDESDDDLPKKNRMAYERHMEESYPDETITDSENEEEDLEMEEYVRNGEEESEEEVEEEEAVDRNPLVVDLETADATTSRKTDMWFNKSIFSGLDGEEDEDLEIEEMTEEYRQKGGIILGKEKKASKRKRKEIGEENSDSGHASESGDEEESDSDDDSDDDSDSSDADSDYDIHNVMKKTQRASKNESSKAGHKDGFEVVPAEEPARKVARLDAEGLAIGEEIIKSKKRRREIEEESFNRYTFNDEHLPDWFVKDEKRHMRKPLPITKEMVDAYKERQKAIDARPIKKIAEAKARKKRKGLKKLEKARKKAEVVTETVDVSEREKWHQIKAIYKKAGLLKNQKPEVAYVVAKKGVGKKVSRPAGVKGRFKVVDPRLKKDMRNKNTREKKQGGKKGKSGGGRGKGRGRK